MDWNLLANFVYYKNVQGDVLQSLKNIEIEMVKTDISTKRYKTVGNALAIVGTIAAPFTFGASLLTTGVGIGINVASTLGESALLSFYVEKANEELRKYDDIREKLQSWNIDWQEVYIQLGKAAIDATFIEIIRRMVPKATCQMIKRIPTEIFITILQNFLNTIRHVFATVRPSALTEVTTTALGACGKQICSEVAETVSKLASKKLLIAVVSFAVIIEVADIIRIWRKDRPKAIKAVQDAIKALEKELEPPSE